MKALRARRVGPGFYEVPTPHATYRVEYMKAPRGSGADSGWFVFVNSGTMAITYRPTKREAMEYIQYVCLGDPDFRP